MMDIYSCIFSCVVVIGVVCITIAAIKKGK